MQYLIGVDGGATKSSASLANINGKMIAKRKGSALNYHAVGQKQTEESLRKLLQPFFRKYREIKAVAIGFAGLDTPYDFRVYKKIAERVLPAKTKFFIFNDAQIALEAACPDPKGPRILIISGTGSSVYGEFKSKKAKAIGWDFLAGDQGSAYWMGMETLKKAVQSWDGRGEKTILEKMVLQKSRSQDMPQFLSKLYQDWHERHRDFKKHIASFALEVEKASLKRDSVARKIIEEAAWELALGVEAVAKKIRIRTSRFAREPCSAKEKMYNNLGIGRESVCIGFVGSNFKIPRLLSSLCLKIKRKYPRVNFVYKVDSTRGAVNLAVKYVKIKKYAR